VTGRVASGPRGAVAPTPSPRAAIISPVVDALSTGGLSILVLAPLLALGRTDLLLLSAGVQAWGGALVNMPHFLASYRMVYRTRASIRAHPWASIYVPGVLLASCVAGVVAAQWTPLPITVLLTLSNSYLAWHYTGQAWGMVVSFTYLAGAPLNGLERRLVRASLYVLMAWHVVWFFHNGYADYVNITPLYQGMSLLAAAALGAGVVGFGLHRRRTGRWAPLRAWIPWIAIFVWYATMARVGLPALFTVQTAHALQYLIFPWRVEVNRTRQAAAGRMSGELVGLHMMTYLVVLLGASLLAAIALPSGAMAVVTNWLGTRPGEYTGFAIMTFFNIHHYFTDGVVWKLRDPAVRRDLFGHLVAAAPARANPSGRARRRGRRSGR
jgi:hypothetical protein